MRISDWSSDVCSSDLAAQPEASADAFGFKIGTLDATALKDGDLEAPNDGTTFALGQPTAAVAALLAAAGEPTDVLHLSIQPLPVRGDGRLLLFDPRAGRVRWARGGRPQALVGPARWRTR